MNHALSDSRYWLNFNNNIIIKLESIITLQKSLFSYTLACDSSLFFCSKEMKAI